MKWLQSAFQIWLVGTCQQYGSWSAAGHIHMLMIGQDPICAGLHDTRLDMSRNG